MRIGSLILSLILIILMCHGFYQEGHKDGFQEAKNICIDVINGRYGR